MGRCAFDLCGNIRFILYFYYICEMKTAAHHGRLVSFVGNLLKLSSAEFADTFDVVASGGSQ